MNCENNVFARRGRRTAQLKHSKYVIVSEQVFVKTHNNSDICCVVVYKNMDNSIVDFNKNNSKNKHTTKATNSWLRTYTLWAEDNRL